jgi:GH25 family lysozyme M1 (1,4-beta-N-acetylmuramidase)
MTELKGCDVSQWQHPALVHWDRLDFGIVRASCGSKLDTQVTGHCRAIEAAGKLLGCYHFFCATVPVQAQLLAFKNACSGSKMTLIPWVDVEDYPGHQIGPADVKPLSDFVVSVLDWAGECGIYISQLNWHRLGKPAFVLQRPLWVPHWPAKGSRTRLTKPATPGNVKAQIWQCMVGPQPWGNLQDNTNRGAVDQDVAFEPLPLLVVRPTKFEHPDHEITELEWQEQHFGRDHTFDEEDPG